MLSNRASKSSVSSSLGESFVCPASSVPAKSSKTVSSCASSSVCAAGSSLNERSMSSGSESSTVSFFSGALSDGISINASRGMSPSSPNSERSTSCVPELWLSFEESPAGLSELPIKLSKSISPSGSSSSFFSATGTLSCGFSLSAACVISSAGLSSAEPSLKPSVMNSSSEISPSGASSALTGGSLVSRLSRNEKSGRALSSFSSSSEIGTSSSGAVCGWFFTQTPYSSSSLSARFLFCSEISLIFSP